MNNESGINKEELHAFLDEELEPTRAAEFAKLIANDPALAARVAAFRSDKEQLDKIYGSLRNLPLPPEWLQRIRDASVPRRQSFSRIALSRRGVMAIAASLLLVLTVNFWFVYDRFSSPNEDVVIAEAFAARQDSTRPEESVAVASIAPAARNQVLTMALSMMLKAPDLTRLGYRLENIRIFSGVPGGKAAELAYRDEQNRLFTLYLRHPSSPPRVDLVERDGMRICIWQDDVLSTVMLGEMSAGEMARVASLAYSGLTL